MLIVTHDDRITHSADRVIELVPRFAPSDREPEEVTLAAGDVLFELGDQGDLVDLIEDGEVELYLPRADGTEELLKIATKGDYFGEVGAVLNMPRSASARARTDCRLTAYPVRAFRRIFAGRTLK